MTAGQGNLDTVRDWYARTEGRYEGGGLQAASELIPEIEQRTYHGHDGLRTFFGELQEMLGEVRYAAPEFHALSDELIVVFTRLEGVGRGSDVPVGQDLGLVYEFQDGLVIRLTAFGSHDEAMRAAQEHQRA